EPPLLPPRPLSPLKVQILLLLLEARPPTISSPPGPTPPTQPPTSPQRHLARLYR
ncbi:unnamed protein product, partial [Ectocarpus sp. 8 AP-2014]